VTKTKWSLAVSQFWERHLQFLSKKKNLTQILPTITLSDNKTKNMNESSINGWRTRKIVFNISRQLFCALKL
jgi:hypothetical protein